MVAALTSARSAIIFTDNSSAPTSRSRVSAAWTMRARRASLWRSRREASCTSSAIVQLEAFEVALLAPFGQQGVEFVDPGRVGLAVEAAGAFAALVVVVPGRAGVLEVAVEDRDLADHLHPRLLGLGGGLHGDGAALLHLLDDVGDVAGLVVEHGGHVHR